MIPRIARTATYAFHRTGAFVAAGAAAHDKHGLCVACIVTWRRPGEQPGYARIASYEIEGAGDLHRFVRSAAQGAFRCTPSLSKDFDWIEALFKKGARSPAGALAAILLLLRSWQLAWCAQRAMARSMRLSMQTARSWIYDFDGLDFEAYEAGRTAESLKAHTRNGEIIVHRDEEGALSVIEKETVTPWPAGHSYDVFHYPWFPSDFPA